MNSKKIALVVIVIVGTLALWLFFSSQQMKKQKTQTISAGGAEGYDKFTLSVPSDWSVIHDTAGGIDRLKLDKQGYRLHISQEPGDGFECLYDEKTMSAEEDDLFSENFTSFTELATKDGTKLRRGLDSDGNSFVVCEQKDNNWSSPTSVGYVGYSIPENPDEAILKEMDTIISSLSK